MPSKKHKDCYKVVVVDDHKILRDGLRNMINEMPDFELIGEASNGKECVDLLQNLKPNLVVMDINMPLMNGLDATRIIKQRYPEIKILVLSMLNDEQFYTSMIELDVQGFVLKEAGYNELQRAMQIVMSGAPFFSQELLLSVIRQKNSSPLVSLSAREHEILTLMCKGFSSQEIADQLFVSVRTIEKHRSDLLLRTESPNAISLVVYAIKNNLVNI